MIATSDTVQSEPHSHTEYVNFEPSQQTVMEQTKRFSYRQSHYYHYFFNLPHYSQYIPFLGIILLRQFLSIHSNS